jgi:hypothetical protein
MKRQGLRLDTKRATRAGREAAVNRGLDANASVHERNGAAPRTLRTKVYKASRTI